MSPISALGPRCRTVAVCTHVECAGRGSVRLVASLRRQLRDAGAELVVRITATRCLGRCAEGPTLAVLPDGVWYRGVREADAAELVYEHLLHDRLALRLLGSAER